MDADGDEFCVTGWLKPSARLGQEELWHARCALMLVDAAADPLGSYEILV